MKYSANQLAKELGTNAVQICRWRKAKVFLSETFDDTDLAIGAVLLEMRQMGFNSHHARLKSVADGMRAEFRDDEKNWLMITDMEVKVFHDEDSAEEYLMTSDSSVATYINITYALDNVCLNHLA